MLKFSCNFEDCHCSRMVRKFVKSLCTRSFNSESSKIIMCPTKSVCLCELSFLHAFIYLRSERNTRKFIQSDSMSVNIFARRAEVTVRFLCSHGYPFFFLCLALLVHHHSLLASVSYWPPLIFSLCCYPVFPFQCFLEIYFIVAWCMRRYWFCCNWKLLCIH